jgi:hypothetical protein
MLMNRQGLLVALAGSAWGQTASGGTAAEAIAELAVIPVAALRTPEP